MNCIEHIKLRARENKKTIVLPESMDSRVVRAASMIEEEKLADVILIGDVEEISKMGIDISNITVINPKSWSHMDEAIEKLVDIRKNKGLEREKARELLLSDYMYFACMLVKMGYADGIVSGACHSTANTLRPALQIIKTKPDTELVSAFFLMEVPDCHFGSHGTFIFADCGLVQNPTSSELATIAGSSAKSFELLVGEKANVALLSHSTKGSASHTDVDKVVSALQIAKEKYPQYNIDGELQLDAAIVSDVARTKAPNSTVAGKANVLIFPDLDAGNIGYKLVQRLAKAKAFGPICQGIAVPVNDLSRGCSVDDIVGVVAITCVQAQNN